tara:strand:+ start:321 stop:707 length:387 start_codon:yes stop_codon:yes gene_type:complete
MTEALYVILGMAIWGFFSYIFNAARQLFYLRQTEKIAILMLATVIEDIEYIKMLKYKTMEEQDVHENKIKVARNLDEENLKRWKDMSIKNLISVYPRKLRGTVKYHDWKSAINWLQAQAQRSSNGRRK